MNQFSKEFGGEMAAGDDHGRVENEIEEILARTASDGATAAPQGAREPLDRELRSIKETVIRMGSMAEAAIRDALDALVTHNAEKATAVIIGDRKINDMQHEVITAITTTIATQSPVARDLRNLLMMNHVVYELERIGDHAKNISEYVVYMIKGKDVRHVTIEEMELVARS